MFTLRKSPEFTHEVPVMVPVDGGFKEEKLKVRFRAVDGTINDDADGSDDGRAFLRARIVAFFDVVDDGGKPIPYSDALRDQMLDFAYIRIGVWRAYNDAMAGARVKN